MCIAHFVYPFVHQWAFGLLLPFGCVTNAAMHVGVDLYGSCVSVQPPEGFSNCLLYQFCPIPAKAIL